MSLTKVSVISAQSKDQINPPDRPTAVWTGKTCLMENHPALTIFSRHQVAAGTTAQCAGMFWQRALTPSHDDLMKQFEHAMSRCKDEEFILKIFTSGSFLDDKEIGSSTRIRCIKAKRKWPGKKSDRRARPEYVTDDTYPRQLQPWKEVWVAMGLETSNELYERLHQQRFFFSDFTRQAKLQKEWCNSKGVSYAKAPISFRSIAMNDMINP